jgi:hypothetical protein
MALIYQRMLSLLDQAGHPKPLGSTPGEFIEELRLQGFPQVLMVEQLTYWYYDCRYGGCPLTEESMKQGGELLAELKKHLIAEDRS